MIKISQSIQNFNKKINKNPYPHDRRADKDSYPHDRMWLTICVA